MTVMHFVMFEPKQGIEQALVDDVRLYHPLSNSLSLISGRHANA